MEQKELRRRTAGELVLSSKGEERRWSCVQHQWLAVLNVRGLAVLNVRGLAAFTGWRKAPGRMGCPTRGQQPRGCE